MLVGGRAVRARVTVQGRVKQWDKGEMGIVQKYHRPDQVGRHYIADGVHRMGIECP
jgi:hypothetical protein